MQKSVLFARQQLVPDDQTGNPKKLYSFIKSKKCDASGVAPLTLNGVSYSDSVKKATILNDQFTSGFTEEELSPVPELNSTDHPSGVASFTLNGVSFSESLKKANILNDQFTSGFTEEDLSTVPELNSTDHPSVQPIVVNRK